ncbi:RTA1 like protein-domain-containing protein [Chaetomidium leptoderma]|uniref:RTA1 like protein-domain-containing protein n=1 Tax=Chaetomidium leptoderma TaxID=669021 RepID=A0AAN6VNT1_9PEZI|nr:RTA1 like protein-domain-containing protein [Chaetomidium leptoderma]
MLAVGDCSGEACPIPSGSLTYGNAPAGNAFMLAAFAALVPPVIYAGLRYKTLRHTLLLLAALLVAVVGHVGKIFLVANPTSHAYSAVYLMGTHWAAVLIGSAANLVLPHVMVIYGEEFRLVSDPVYLNILFFILDIFTLAFQSVGIGFASTASTAAEVSQGVNILLTGLAIQAVSLLVFLGTYRYFRYKLSHRRYILDDRYSLVYLSRRFKYFMIGIQVVASLLLVRTAVRIAIFANGLASTFAGSQVAAFLLDDTLVLLAILILTVYPAGRAFGVAWATTSPMASSSIRPNTLPLRLRRHRRNRSSRIDKRIISLPYPSPSTSPRFSPAFTPRGGMTPGLPAHPSPRAPQPGPPLMSPRNNPVHQRVPYDTSPTQDGPFLVSQESPGLDSAMWMTTPPLEHGRKRPMWAGSGQEGNQMVDGDALWN